MKPRHSFHIRLRPTTATLGLLGLSVLSGCGIHYYDAKTGTEHLWGFGHLRMRVQPPDEGVQAVVKGYSIAGAKVGGSQEDYGISVGYDSRRIILITATNAAFGLEWPTASFFNVRVGGTNPPFLSRPIAGMTENHHHQQP